MRLWQKIFLLTLLLCIAAIQTASFVILKSGLAESVEMEQNRAVSRHTAFATVLANQMVFERLQNGAIRLQTAEVEQLLAETIARQEETQGVAVYRGDTYIAGSRNLAAWNCGQFFSLSATTEKQVYITDLAGSTYVLVGSLLTLEGQDYLIITLDNEIAAIYHNYNEQVAFVQKISIGISLLIAVILLLLVLLLLRPLSRANVLIRQIAAGDYSKRMPERGGAEMAELARNINRMTLAVDENVQRMQQLTDRQSQFINNFAHEMKTPLTSILGFADILRIKRVVSVQERTEYAGIIVEEAKRLKGLSGKLLELATAEEVTLELRKIQVETLLEEIGATVTPILQRAQLSLQIHADSFTVCVDKALFQSLLYNLIDNAVKASPPGRQILLTVARDADFAVFQVTDEGCGMDQKHIKRITEPFYMVDKSRARKAGGAGLGLSLCEKIARCHNGTLSIESQLNVGTTIIVTIPLKAGDTDEA